MGDTTDHERREMRELRERSDKHIARLYDTCERYSERSKQLEKELRLLKESPDDRRDWQEAMKWARDHLQTAMARNKKYGVETDEGIYEAETELRKFLEQFDGSKGERDEI